MNLRAKALGILGVLSLLAGCGGGGGSGDNSAFNPQGYVVTVTPASTSSTPSSLVSVTVRAQTTNGAPVADGTSVRLQVTPAGVGLLSSAQSGNAQIPLAESVSATLSGGVANFRLHTRSVGTATLIGSINDPTNSTRTITGQSAVNVQAGPPNDPRLSVQLQSTTLPAVPSGLGVGDTVFIGSPYITQVTVTVRRLDGTLAQEPTGNNNSGGSQFCTSGSGATAAIGPGLESLGLWLPAEGIDDSTDPPTIRLCRSLSLGLNSGTSIFYLTSFPTAGTVNLVLSAIDQSTGETISTQATVNVSNGSGGIPGSVLIQSNTDPQYIQGVNGAQSKQVEVFVYDGGGTLVNAPPTGVDNVQVEIVGGGVGGERLVGVSATGANQSGNQVNVRTNRGIASVTLQSGTRTGTITLRATTDRSDNNVGNGISDPLTSTRAFTISDGKLFAIDLSSELTKAASISTTGDRQGHYQMKIAAVATDRGGNPVAPGTEIRFGLIDSPLVNGDFAIAGTDGDPQEGGTLFTAPTGAFTTAGGGAGPGDSIVLFGEDSNGNEDLEGQRTVAQVFGPTQLTTTSRFNFNDTVGRSVNNGAVVPYVIGRAVDGNIGPSAAVGANGTVSTTMTYSGSKIGRPVIVWAQGAADLVSGSNEIASDVERFRYQGAQQVILTAQPTSISANRVLPVKICARDINNAPIPNSRLRFGFSGLSGGSGSVDGTATTGFLANLTGADGCVTASVSTSGLVIQTGVPKVSFTLDEVTVDVNIDLVAPITIVISAQPSPLVLFGSTGQTGIVVCAIDNNGPLVGAQFIGSCTAASPPGGSMFVENAIPPAGPNGCSQALIDYSDMIFDPDGPGPTAPTLGSGTCVFSILNSLTPATVPVTVSRACNDGFSPPPIGCP